MKAIRCNAFIPRYTLAKTLGRAAHSLLWSGISSTYMDELSPPPLPGSEWLMIRTRHGGICGSDMGMGAAAASPYYEPLTSMPLPLGHENVGYIADIGGEGSGWPVGDWAVVEPLLWCRPRGLDLLCRFWAIGEINRCERFTYGPLTPGMYTVTCSQTGGRVILLGLPGIAKGIDWSSLFAQDLRVNGLVLYHRVEESEGEEISSFAVAINQFSRHNLDLSWLVTHRYEHRHY